MGCRDGRAVMDAGVHESSQAPFPHDLTSLARSTRDACCAVLPRPIVRDSHKAPNVLVWGSFLSVYIILPAA